MHRPYGCCGSGGWAMHLLGKPPIARWSADASPLPALVFLVECVDVREVTTELPVIESVAEDELVGDGKADVVEVEVDFGGVGFMEERDAGERCRVLVPHPVEHVFHRQARVDDVFHHDHMAAFNTGVDFLELGHLAAGDLGGADRKSTRLNSSHVAISYAVFCLIIKVNGMVLQN